MSDSTNASGVRAKFRRILGSSLGRSILCVFLVLVFVEGFFLFLLVRNTLQAEQLAAKEYRTLKALQQCSELVSLMHNYRDNIDAWEKGDHSEARRRRYELSSKKVERELPKFRAIWKIAELPPSVFEELISGCQNMVRDAELYMSRQDVSFYHKSVDDTHAIYPRAVKVLQLIQDLLEKQRKNLAKTESPLGILLLDVLLNVILAVTVAVIVQRNLSRPIRVLAQNCEGLKTGEPFPAPQGIRNELNELQAAFHDLSLQIEKNSRGRKGYIRLLKEMQGAKLSKAKQALSQLAGSGVLGEKAQRRLLQLRLSVDDMMRLLDSMTEGLSFNADEKIELCLTELELSELIQRALASVEPLLQKKQIALVSEIEPGSLACDPALLSRVLVNLLSNAIKFSPPNSTLKLSCRRLDGAFRFIVRDSGPGISEEGRKRLFQKFSQLDSNEKRSGSGLGLMICKQIVEAHGGTIGCDSTPGAGSSFWFELAAEARLDISDSAGGAVAAAKDRESLLLLDGKSASAKKRGSIQTVFGGMLLLFFLTQFACAFSLGFKFLDIEETARRYDQEQRLILASQRMFASFFTFGTQIKGSINTGDLTELGQFLPSIDRLLAQVEEAEKESRAYPQLLPQISRIGKYTRYLQKQSAELPDGVADITELLAKYKAYIIANQKITTLLFNVIDQESSLLDKSYDLGAKLRAELLVVLLVCAIVNLLLLLVLATTALKVLNKLQLLTRKLDEFARGAVIKESLTGDDELSCLDESLCAVVRSIREAELQRAELLAVINHDLRTPLGALLGGIEILRVGVEDLPADEIRLALDELEPDLRSLLDQINNLLLLEKLDSGSVVPDAVCIDLCELLEDLVLEFEEAWKVNGIRVRLKIAEGLDNAMVNGELGLLTLIFRALLRNACSAVPSGSEVKLMISKCEEGIRVDVADNGSGIEGELQQQIFERFRVVAGEVLPGLGLPLASRLARLHGAVLALETSNAEGTVFSLIIPSIVS